MHLSSLFLSTTALLAQAASANFVLFPTLQQLEAYGAAKIESNRWAETADLPLKVGFNLDYERNSVAQIHLDSEGDIGSEFFLRTVGPGRWALLSRNNGSIPVSIDDITKPFGLQTVDGVDRFVYQGGENDEFGWVVCQRDDWRIHLVSTLVEIEDRSCETTHLSAIPAPA